MKILVTGGAGFIGSNLCENLIAEGHKVKVIDNLITGRISNLELIKDHPSFEFIKSNVIERAVTQPLVEWCDHIYHLAAPVGVKFIMEHPVLTILDNIRAIDLILELANKFQKRILVASTSEVYGKSLDLLDPTSTRKLNEEDYRIEGSTRNHRWAYANTKSLDEFLSLAYKKEFGTEVVIARFFNTVGPRQLSLYGMVIPNFVQRALKNEDLKVYGSGEQKRSFMHVKDTIRAIKALMFTGKGLGEVFNIGNPVEISINDLARKVISLTGSKSEITHVSYREAYGEGFEDMNRRTADISKLCKTVDFEIEFTLDLLLKDIINSYEVDRLKG